MDWRSFEAPRGQQRRGYSDRTSERSRGLVGARAVWEAKSLKNWVCDSLDFFKARRTVKAVLRAFGGSAAAAPVVLPLAMATSRL